MKIATKIKRLPNSSDDKDMYQLSIKTYNQSFEGKFEKSELRHLIGTIDNEMI